MKERESNVLSLLEDKTNIYARKIALGMKTQFGWKELTYDGLGLMSRRLAAYLMNDLGIQRGEKLAILSESKPEYGACVFASVISGLITVPLDIKLTKYITIPAEFINEQFKRFYRYPIRQRFETMTDYILEMMKLQYNQTVSTPEKNQLKKKIKNIVCIQNTDCLLI